MGHQAEGTSQTVDLIITPEDPRTADVSALLEAHLAFLKKVTPIEYSFALDPDGLLDHSVTFFAARRGGELVGVGAVKHLDPMHGEFKSMHTREDVRGQGIGRAMVEHLLGFARLQGYRRVSLETGSTSVFGSARALYTRAGFRPCEPFGEYRASAYNTFMTIDLGERIRPETMYGVVDSAELQIRGVRLRVETLLTDEDARLGAAGPSIGPGSEPDGRSPVGPEFAGIGTGCSGEWCIARSSVTLA